MGIKKVYRHQVLISYPTNLGVLSSSGEPFVSFSLLILGSDDESLPIIAKIVFKNKLSSSSSVFTRRDLGNV